LILKPRKPRANVDEGRTLHEAVQERAQVAKMVKEVKGRQHRGEGGGNPPRRTWTRIMTQRWTTASSRSGNEGVLALVVDGGKRTLRAQAQARTFLRRRLESRLLPSRMRTPMTTTTTGTRTAVLRRRRTHMVVTRELRARVRVREVGSIGITSMMMKGKGKERMKIWARVMEIGEIRMDSYGSINRAHDGEVSLFILCK
jgi:hypothetical protein